jgi:hypothetical protein
MLVLAELSFVLWVSYLFSGIIRPPRLLKISGISQRSAGSFYKFSDFLQFSFFPLAGTCLPTARFSIPCCPNRQLLASRRAALVFL